MFKQHDLTDFVNTDWQPLSVSTSASLAEAILDDGFQSALAAMLVEFKTIIPTEYDDEEGRRFVPMAEKNRLLEKHFPFGTFHVATQFINDDADSPVCCATLMVLTDVGYEPWFSRMGMSNSENTSTDGKMADAETSARRRLLVALGLGYEGMTEIVDSENVRYVNIIKEQLALKGNVALLRLVDEYRNHGNGLTPLRGSYPALSNSEIEKFGFQRLASADLKLLAGFAARKVSKR